MRIPLTILLGSTLLLTGCAQFQNRSLATLTSADIAALEELEDLPSNRPVQIATRFHEGRDVLAAPSVVARSGQTAAIEIASDISYPTRFTLAETIRNAGQDEAEAAPIFPITPARPDRLTSTSTGISLECTPKIVGPFIEISGTIIFRWHEGDTSTAAAGAGIGAITTDDGRVVISDNRHDLPVFGSRSTPFFVRALPGETYTLTVRGESNPITIQLTANLMAPARGELATAGRSPFFLASR